MVVLCLIIGFIVIVAFLIGVLVLSLFVSALNFLIPFLTIVSALLFITSLVTLIVLTRKGKFSREKMEQYKLMSYGKLRMVLMRILQIFLWIFWICSMLTTAAYIAYWVIKPFDSFLGIS